MRLLLSVCFAASLASAAEWGQGEVATWIESIGGAIERNEQGRIVGVDLRSKWVTDDDLALLARLDGVERIDLSYTWISDQGMEHLKDLRNVRELQLAYCDLLSDAAVVPLKGWRKLEVLNLEGTDVTSTSFEHLAGVTSLKSLRVGHSRVEDEGFENLAPLTSLEELGTGGNKMSGRALPLLKMLPSLRRLDLGGLQRTDSGLWGLALSDYNLDALAELTELEELRLNEMRITDRGLSRLETLVRLETLDLSGTAVTGAGISVLAKFPNLRELRLWRADGVGDEAGEALLQLERLETLDLAETPLGDGGLRSLGRAPALRHIYVGGSRVTSAGVEAFRDANPGIQITWWEKPAPPAETFKNEAP